MTRCIVENHKRSDCNIYNLGDGFQRDLAEYLIYCNSALKILETELSLISDEFNIAGGYNPIDHIKCRVKTVESIVGKVIRKNIQLQIASIDNSMTDIVGARIVCPFLSDAYQVIKLLKKNKKLKILQEQDYITAPKSCGYSSYHIIVEVPVNLSKGYRDIKAEIQVRTLGMDFWATLEHKLNYKIATDIPNELVKNLHSYAMKIYSIDRNMDSLAKLLLNTDLENVM